MRLPHFKARRLVAGGAVAVAAVVTAVAIRAADHRDTTLLTNNPGVDINDVYAFVSPSNPANVVLAMTVSPFVAPAENGTRFFEPDALYQFKIDTNADAVEDLVIQAVPTKVVAGRQDLLIYGPAKPERTGSTNRLIKRKADFRVRVSENAEVRSRLFGGIRVFAGLRDDPFFFDLTQFRAVVSGQASGFRNPGIDTFAGFNTLSIVVELPAASLGPKERLGVWATTSRVRSGL
ncbi:MAG: DUF4331 domain-containing protein [Gemmatimonadetes bacterium]|nr:DUF4331 domain-containing protein [Gemmatimonadota bacterium]